MNKRTHTITITAALDEGAIASALISAVEGGSRYWASGFRVVKGRGAPGSVRLVEAYGGTVGAMLSAGSVVRFTENAHTDEPVQRTVTREGVIKALGIMAAEYPKAFARVCVGGDQDSGDTLLQLAALGEVVYG